MNLSKTSFVLGNAFGAVAVGAFVIACGGGSGPAVPMMLKASDVIVRSGAPLTSSLKSGMLKVQASEPKVLASNVALVTASNDLASRDLQSALDNEMAVDLAETIVGVWDIENFPPTAPGGLCSRSSGRVQFNSDGSYVLLSGALSAANDILYDAAAVAEHCAVRSDVRRFTLVGKGVYFQGELALTAAGPFGPTGAVSSINEATVNTMTFFNGTSISRLTRVVQRPISVPAPATTPTMKVAVSGE